MIRGKKLTALLLALVLALGLAACGGGDSKDGDAQELSGMVYVPSFIDFDADLSYIESGCSDGRNIYLAGSIDTETEKTDPETGETYTEYDSRYTIVRVPLDGGEAAELENFSPSPLPDGAEGSVSLRDIRAGAEGTPWVTESMYTYTFDLPAGFDETTDSKYNYMTDSTSTEIQRQLDSTGNEIARVDASGLLEKLETDYISATVFDGEGDMFVAVEGKLAVLDPSLNVKFTIEEEGLWGDSVVLLSDGRVGVCASYQEAASDSYGYKVRPVDKAAKGWAQGEEYILPPNAYTVYPGGGDYLFYYQQSDRLCGWNTEKNEGEQLLSWIDSDINSSEIEFFSFLPDGRVAVMTRSWDDMGSGSQYEIAVLTATDRASLPEKTTLSYATMYLGYDERNSIVEFNKTSDKYRIEVRDYSQFNTAEDSTAGLTKLNTEIVAGNVPDILNTAQLPIRQYAAKGLLEDLWPYIENDAEIGGRAGLMERPFQAAEIGGKLYQVFDSFSIHTVIGNPDIVGDRYTWTLGEMKEALAKMPEGCSLFGESDTQSYMLSEVLNMQLTNFVDWETGECSFDSDGFKAILEFCGSFPAEFDWESVDYDEWESEPARISAGKQMLMSLGVSDFTDIQMYKAFFGGKVSFIGYPREDGSVGSGFMLNNCLALSTTCKDKEGAWSYMRQLLLPQYADLDESGSMWGMGGAFSSNKADFEKMAKLAMKAEYETDENGNPVLDENGNPIEVSNGGWSWDGFDIEVKATTQDEYDQIMGLYNAVEGLDEYDQKISEIVSDEAAACFAGDKTLDECAGQIQSRVKLYVNENR